MIRKQLETSLGVKVDEHKDFIRSQARSHSACLLSTHASPVVSALFAVPAAQQN